MGLPPSRCNLGGDGAAATPAGESGKIGLPDPLDHGEDAVSTYKVITLAGTSPQSFAKAAEVAVTEAAKTLRGLAWFHVKEMRGRIREGKIAEYQVLVEMGFKLE
jgi:hypothetical protein